MGPAQLPLLSLAPIFSRKILRKLYCLLLPSLSLSHIYRNVEQISWNGHVGFNISYHESC